MITKNYRRKLDKKIIKDISKMVNFLLAMKQNFIILPSLIEKYKYDICFMVERDVTCMEEVELR